MTFDSAITAGYGITFNNSNFTATGTIRLSLWAVSTSFNGGTISGTRIATFTPNFTGPGAFSSTRLSNGAIVSNATSIGSGTTPSAGSYCMVMTLDMFDSSTCTSSDFFCYTDWVQFPGATTFN